jgi:hypothetical protein
MRLCILHAPILLRKIAQGGGAARRLATAPRQESNLTASVQRERAK